jgi:predicted DNA-binding antitoxin AbrB/MazE fold protein
MTVTVEATYENGVLKLDQPLPLSEQQRVVVVVHTQPSRARQSAGLMGWKGDAATVEYFALSPDLDPGEEP